MRVDDFMSQYVLTSTLAQVNNSACKYPGVEGRAYAWIGTNMKIRTPYLHLPRASCFYGQMGCIYVFKEALKDEVHQRP